MDTIANNYLQRDEIISLQLELLHLKNKEINYKEVINKIYRNNKIIESIIDNDESINTLLDIIPIAVSIIQDSRIVYMNSEYIRIVGFPYNELQNMYSWEVIHPDMQNSIKQKSLPHQITENLKNHVEMKLLNQNQNIKWADVFFVFIEYHSKPAFLLFGFDITNRKSLENDLNQSIIQLNNVERIFKIGHYEVNLQTDEIMLSSELLKITGLNTLSERPSLEKVMSLIHPEDKDNIINIISKNLEEKKPSDIIFRFIKNGSDIRYVINKSDFAYDNEHNPIKVFGVIQDITDIKKQELEIRLSNDNYKSLFDNCPISYFILDKNGIVIDFNNACLKLFGYDTKEDALGRWFGTFVDHKHLDYIVKAFNNIISLKQINSIEIPIRHKNGNLINSIINIHVQLNKENSVNQIYCVLQDLTERKKVESALLKSETMLSEATKMANLGYWEWDFSIDEVNVSDLWLKIYGVTNNKLSFSEMLFLTHYDDLKKMRKAINESLENQTPYNIEHRIINQTTSEIKYVRSYGEIIVDEFQKPIKMYGAALDLTGQKKVEDDLRDSKEKYKMLVETLQEGIWMSDQDGITLYANPCLASMLKYSSEEMIGKHIFDFTDLEGQEKLRNSIELLMYGITETQEYKLICKDKTQIYVILKNAPVFDSNGIFTGGIASVNDITKNRQAEIALQESEKRFRTLFENQGEGVFIFNLDNVITFANPAAEEIFGVERNHLIGLHLKEYLPPETYSLLVDIAPVKKTEKKRSYEIDIIPPDNVIRKILATVTTNYDENNQENGYFVIFRDITERVKFIEALRNSEEKFRQLAENIQQIFWLRTHDKFEYISPAYEQITGYSAQSLYINPNVSEDNVHPDDEIRVKQAYSSEEYLSKGLLKEEYRIIKPDGTIRWMSARAFPVYDENNNIVRIAGISEDITERKDSEEEIKVLVEQLMDANEEVEIMLEQKNQLVQELEASKMTLEETNASKDKFFSIIAHDLRSPFSGFLGLTKLLVESINSMSKDEVRVIVSNLLLAANSLYKLIENLLEWSRLQREAIVPSFMNLTLINSIRESVDYITYNSDLKNIAIKYNISKDIIVYVDMNLFDSILRNLISNAIKFTYRGGEINIFAEVLDNNFVKVNIKDNGIGMSPNTISKLFKITEKVSTKGTEGEPSTGLGLMLCKEYVDLHGGKISVESTEGVGSTFSFTVPIGTKVDYSFLNNFNAEQN